MSSSTRTNDCQARLQELLTFNDLISGNFWQQVRFFYLLPSLNLLFCDSCCLLYDLLTLSLTEKKCHR
jgi:hypothetical protein